MVLYLETTFAAPETKDAGRVENKGLSQVVEQTYKGPQIGNLLKFTVFSSELIWQQKYLGASTRTHLQGSIAFEIPLNPFSCFCL